MEKILISEERYGHKLNNFEDNDIIDRLNSRYTILALIMCIFIITGKTYVGDPINCWTPAQFTGTHNSYTNSICWLKGSYYLPTEEITIPDRSKPRSYHVSYYQWTPFILLGMSMFFLLPHLLWQAFIRQGSMNIRQLIHTIKTKQDGVDTAKKSYKNYIDTQNHMKGSICCGIRCSNMYFGYTAAYFTVKILYIINSLAQFFLLNAFLSFNFSAYGVEAVQKLFSGEDWFESPRFPRVTMCDFMIRHLGSNQHWYAIQCNLPVNMYNEKIFFGLWIWLILITILNVLSLIFWIISLSERRRVATVKKFLKIHESASEEDSKLVSEDTRSSRTLRSPHKTYRELVNTMHIDGYFVFRIISHNTDDIAAGSLLEYLATNQNQSAQRKENSK